MQGERDNQSKNVLIVSGDADTRMFLSTALIGCGYHTIEAIGGSDTFKILPEVNAKIVVSDINLPDIDGITLCQ